MEIPSKKVYELLKDKGVENIYHANSVITSCQFLRNGALLSRGTVARRGMYQTPQKSDDLDKRTGVWFDVFTDSVDIHNRARRLNFYGPVLFALDIKIISKSYTGKIWVTKLNPTKWEGKNQESKWFTSAKDLEDNFEIGRFDQMIVFRHCGGELPIKRHLKKLLLDDPKLCSKKTKVDYYSMAFGALRLSMTEGGIEVPIDKRKCREGCSCVEGYANDVARTSTMYVPKL